ncbi:MAG: M28 family peptidase [Candidatus Zixiibacteriota bacterium]
MRNSLIIAAVLIIGFASIGICGDIYKVTLENQVDADLLISLDIEPLVRIGNEYIVQTNKSSSVLLLQSGLKAQFLAAGIIKDDMVYDNSLDKSNADKFQVVFEIGGLRILRVDNFKSLAPGDRKNMHPINNKGLKIFFKPPRAYNPSFVLQEIGLDSLISLVEEDSCNSFVNQLQSYNRVAGTASNRASRDWIRDKFIEFGYADVTIPSFYEYVYGYYRECFNVVAVKPGSVYPNRQIVFGAHFDAVPGSPGADDNGSGTAGVLEIARILYDLEMEMTIVFALFDAEEEGLLGAYDYAYSAQANGDSIICMLNMDMIGYYENHWDLDIGHGDNTGYALLMEDLGQPLTNLRGHLETAGANSDHYPFLQAGYEAIFAAEHIFSTIYHSFRDSTSYMDFEYMSRMVQLVAATGYSIDKLPFPVAITSVLDVGDGQSLQVNWVEGNPSEIESYKVNYNSTTISDFGYVYVPGNTSTYVLSGLVEGAEYEITVFSVNHSSQASLVSDVVTQTPYFLPRPPQQLAAQPGYHSIQLNWRTNNYEMDFSHYAIIRDEVILPDHISGDNWLDDNFSLGDMYHSYHVVAVDNEGNISDTTGIDPVVSRAATLEPGKMLVVNRSNYTSAYIVDAAMTGQFMRDALAGFDFDYISDSAYTAYPDNIGLEDLLDYELIVLGGEAARTDDFGWPDISGGILEDIDDYMSTGGRVIIFGRWGDININTGENIISFSPGKPDYAYRSRFNINTRKQLLTMFDATAFYSDLVGAHTVADGYPELVWDSLATVHHSAPWQHCAGIPCPTYASLTGSDYEVIYTYDSRHNSYYEGQPIAWRNLSNNYKYIFFEFPLTFMEPASAALALQTAVTELLSEGPSGVTIIDPDTVHAESAPEYIAVYLGNFGEGLTASDVEQVEIKVNGTVLPYSVSIISSHPDFVGDVVQIDVSSSQFIDSYGIIADTSTFGYMVSWKFTGDAELKNAYGEVTLSGSENQFILGDANGDWVINIGDAVYLINNIFKGGPSPEPRESGDANCDGAVNVGDAVYIINTVFKGGPPPGCF